MKRKLHIKERLYLMNILPQENSLVNFQLKKGLMKKVELTDEDREKFEIKVYEESQNMTWNAQKDFDNPTEFEFSDMECEYVRKAIEALSDGQHPDEYWLIVTTLYDKLQNTESTE